MGAKVDLSRYFRNILVDLGQVPYLCIGWDGQVYIDLVFSFGN